MHRICPTRSRFPLCRTCFKQRGHWCRPADSLVLPSGSCADYRTRRRLGFARDKSRCDTHRVMFHKTSFPNGMTPPGQLSHRPRYCNLRGDVRHWYPVPDDMSEALGALLDCFNARYDSCRDMYDLALFCTCAWLISHFLALHPFADGNGRLAQILCSYVLAEHQPFPMPVCDAAHYLPSLLKAQSTGDIDALAACVAQSSCLAWKKLIDFL